MATQALGYSRLIADYQLKSLPLLELACADSAARGRSRRDSNGQVLQVYEPSYAPDDSLVGHLQFALKYEGVNLQVLSLLFEQDVQESLENWLLERPASSYARRACFLFEWTTGRGMSDKIQVPGRESYVNAVDDKLQFALPGGERNTRFRVIDNLPGTCEFCPMVRKTAFLTVKINPDLIGGVRIRIGNTLYDGSVVSVIEDLERALLDVPL